MATLWHQLLVKTLSWNLDKNTGGMAPNRVSTTSCTVWKICAHYPHLRMYVWIVFYHWLGNTLLVHRQKTVPNIKEVYDNKSNLLFEKKVWEGQKHPQDVNKCRSSSA